MSTRYIHHCGAVMIGTLTNADTGYVLTLRGAVSGQFVRNCPGCGADLKAALSRGELIETDPQTLTRKEG